jgi:hypothetical protein
MISNLAIRDKRLSFRARGLHHLLLSYPDGWKVKVDHLKSESDKEGKDAIASALKELELLGYLVRTQIRDKGRIMGYESVIRELPIDNPPKPTGRRGKKPQPDKPDTVEPQPDEPDMAEPDTANPVHNKYLFNELSREELSREELSIPPIAPHKGEDTSPERGGGEIHTVVVEVVTQNEEITAKQSLVVQSPIPTSQEQIVPGRENNNQAQKLRPIQQIFEESGKIINYGTEYKDWIQADMGDIIKHYRRSGRALTTSPNDIDSDFKNFTSVNANNGKGMKLSAIQGWVVNCEKDPFRWGELRDLVAEWVLAKATGDRFTNIAQEINRDAKQQATANNLMSMLSDRLSQRNQP